MKDQLKERIIEINYKLLVNFDNKEKVKKLRDELLIYINLYLSNEC